MSLLEVARDALKDLPLADIVRERLSLALDEYGALERKFSEVQEQVGELKAELKMARAAESTARAEIKRLEKENEEGVLIVRTIEFRRGKRTEGQWRPFCPRCHLPVAEAEDPTFPPYCTDIAHCGWNAASLSSAELVRVIATLPT